MASIGCCSLATEPVLLDCRGLKCPLPVLKAEKQLALLPPGASLVLLATDPMAKVDIPLYCQQNGHAIVLTEADGVLSFSIRKKT